MVAQIRVLLLSEPTAETGRERLPRLLCEVLSHAITSQDDMQLIGPVRGEDDLQEVLSHDGADVIVMSCPPGGLSDRGARLLSRRPPLRIVCVTSDGRSSVLHELTPASQLMGEVSPDQILDAIRNGFNGGAEAGPSDLSPHAGDGTTSFGGAG